MSVVENGSRLAGMRHATSYANDFRVITFGDVAAKGYGLPVHGKHEALCSASGAKQENLFGDRELIVVTGEPLRHRQTGEEVLKIFPKAKLLTDARLNERKFPELWNKTSTASYVPLWRRDAQDPTHTDWGVESVTAIWERMLQTVTDLIKQYPHAFLLLISSADPLRIYETGSEGRPLGTHANRPWKQAEIRRLKVVTSNEQ